MTNGVTATDRYGVTPVTERPLGPWVKLYADVVDRKAHYTDHQFRSLIEVLSMAVRLHGFLPSRRALAAREGQEEIDFLFEEGDLEECPNGAVAIHRWRSYQSDPTGVGRRQGGAARTANWRLRTAVYERDHYTCRYCGIEDYPRQWLVLEHVIPGGPTTAENLVTACRGCNKVKGGRTPEQAGMALCDVGDTSRDTSQSPVTYVTPSASASSSEPLRGNDGEELTLDDPVYAYFELTARYPKGNALAWVKRLGDVYGFLPSSVAMTSAWAESDEIGTLLSRTEDRLVASERSAELREKAEEKVRLRQKRATVRIVDPGPEKVGAIMGDIRKVLGR